VRSLIEGEKPALTRESESSSLPHQFSRILNLKPQRPQFSRTKKNLSSAKVLCVDEQEKSGAPQKWNRTALHAHHCCVSQRHPAYVHLERLLVKVHPLHQRITLWKMQKYLCVARTLEAFVKAGLGEKPRKERHFSAFACTPSPVEKEQWDEYLNAQPKRLFEVRNPTK